MKIRNLSKLALAVAISSSVVLEGCKKYDDDITRLEESINQNKTDIASLKTQLQSLAATNVVESVSSITGGFRITFKNAAGQSTTYDVVNGATGATGATGAAGKDGATGAAGTPGTQWRINATTKVWESSTNGTTWNPTNPAIKAEGTTGATGATGATGKDGATPQIKKGTDGKSYWFVNDTNTGVQASAGDITLVTVDGGYNVVFTDSKGNVSDTIFLGKEQVAVSSLALVPTYTKDNNPVIFFPRIVNTITNKTTVLQGYGTIKYNLNPFGVAVANFDAKGLLTKLTDEVTFRSTGSGAAVSTSFSVLQDKTVKNFGDITVNVKPQGDVSKIFSTTQPLFVALQVENKKAAEGQKFVASNYNLAKEELVERDEVTIEKSSRDAQATGDKVTLLNGVTPSFSGTEYTDGGNSSRALAFTQALASARTDANFTLHYKNNASENLDNNSAYEGGIVLDEKLNGFFNRTQVGGVTKSMDDYGLSDYNLRYDIDHYGSSAQERDWLVLDAETGKVSVKISTTNTKTYNSAAVNNNAIIRVRMYAGAGNAASDLITTRYIKVGFVQSAAQQIAVTGTINHKVVSTVSVNDTITWDTPTTLDAAYNKTGKTAQDFHAVYTFTPDATTTTGTKNPAGISFNTSSMNSATQGNPRTISIANTVMPNTYTLTGTYQSSISSDPKVAVTITVKVTADLITNLTKKAPFWNSGLTYGIINGKEVGGTWKLNANLWDYFTESTVTNVNKPVTTYEFSVNTPTNSIAVNGSEVTLDDAIALARTKVNNGDVSLRVTRKVNGVVYDISDFSKDFNVKFINPVKAIDIKTPYREFKDKETSGTNTSLVDVRQLVKLTDFNNKVLFDYNGTTFTADNSLLGKYGVSNINTANNYQFTQVEFVRAEDANGTNISLSSSSRAYYSGNSLVWENQGANLQQAIYLVFKVTVTNKFNQGDVDATKAEVVKEFKVKVNPNI